MEPLDFEPQLKSVNTPQIAPELTTPEPIVDLSSPQAVAQAWQDLYYNFPSDGLAKRVKEAKEWATQQTTGAGA